MRRFASILAGCALLALVGLSSSLARAAVIHNEGIDGDISGNMAAPTSHTLAQGSNQVIATSVSGDREYLHLSLPPSLALSAIVLDAYAGIDGTAFIGVQAGTTFTETFGSPNVANLLGYSHFGPTAGAGKGVGSDLLDDISTGAGAQGFTPPLTAPNYTFWIQQTGGNAATYTLDFIVVPEPSTMCLLGIGGLMTLVAGASRRRRTR